MDGTTRVFLISNVVHLALHTKLLLASVPSDFALDDVKLGEHIPLHLKSLWDIMNPVCTGALL